MLNIHQSFKNHETIFSSNHNHELFKESLHMIKEKLSDIFLSLNDFKNKEEVRLFATGSKCSFCDGTGVDYHNEGKCPICDSKGILEENEEWLDSSKEEFLTLTSVFSMKLIELGLFYEDLDAEKIEDIILQCGQCFGSNEKLSARDSLLFEHYQLLEAVNGVKNDSILSYYMFWDACAYVFDKYAKQFGLSAIEIHRYNQIVYEEVLD